MYRATYTTPTHVLVNHYVLYGIMQGNHERYLNIIPATNIRLQAHYSLNKANKASLEAFDDLLSLTIIVDGPW